MELICRSEIRLVNPRLIRWYIVGSGELWAPKDMAHDRHALLRQPCAHLMDALKIRSQPVNPPHPPFDARDARIALITLTFGRW